MRLEHMSHLLVTRILDFKMSIVRLIPVLTIAKILVGKIFNGSSSDEIQETSFSEGCFQLDVLCLAHMGHTFENEN